MPNLKIIGCLLPSVPPTKIKPVITPLSASEFHWQLAFSKNPVNV